MRFPLLAALAALLPALGSADAQPAASAPPAADAPSVVEAQRLSGQAGDHVLAEGRAQLSRGAVSIEADWLRYDVGSETASARGSVVIRRDRAVYRGQELQLHVQRFEGWFLEPEFDFLDIGAGGRARRVDFIDRHRSRITQGLYTSCPREGPGAPDWVLEAERLALDFERNEGIAEGARLRFLGVPLLALPRLSFPVTGERKTGWLPPSLNIDNRSGIEIGVPWYWNIAANRDLTLTPRVITRRGLALESELRYLEPTQGGSLTLDLLPFDPIADRSRRLLHWTHDAVLPGAVRAGVDALRVSDDDWWKDFPRSGRSLTPRLLMQDVFAERAFAASVLEGLAYARARHWQVLRDDSQPIVSPYARSPQLGVKVAGVAGGIEFTSEAELNRFTLREPEASRPEGWRAHWLGSLSRPWRGGGMSLVPRLSFNAAHYDLETPMSDARLQASRVIPTVSVEAGLELERETRAFGRRLRQTLEPRVLYARTPYQRQDQLPVFDTAGRDITFFSIFSQDAFSGVDRVADAHQVTAGFTTRLVDVESGAEALRLGLVQRYLLRPQRVTAQADGTPDGPVLERRFSDVLLLGSTSVLPGWGLDAALQYNPDLARTVRSTLAARYSPGPFRTVGTTYRFARGIAEQLELGWQWPLGANALQPAARAGALPPSSAGLAVSSGGCRGQWYSVGRVNYSLKDSRVTDSVLGVEFDTGCWIARAVAERLSIGSSQTSTRLLLQLELVGLSRLGSSPLKVLNNIPGYRPLRDDTRGPSTAN